MYIACYKLHNVLFNRQMQLLLSFYSMSFLTKIFLSLFLYKYIVYISSYLIFRLRLDALTNKILYDISFAIITNLF